MNLPPSNDEHPSEPLPENLPPNAKWAPYSTPNHRVTKGRYITSTDPRGYVPVFEYPLNNQWIMMDVDDGYVLWTGIWKALGNSKADIVKMVEAQPELASQLRRVRGGYLKIQGTWLPYEVALRLARRVAWPIRDDLVPLFGPTFPATCLSPDQPGYGQVVLNAGKKSKRSKYQPAEGGLGAEPPQHQQHRGYPYSPSSAESASPVGGSEGYYRPMPSSSSSYGGQEYYEDGPSGATGVSRNSSIGSSSTSRHRYAPYPVPTPPSGATPRQDSYALPTTPDSSTHSQSHSHRSPYLQQPAPPSNHQQSYQNYAPAQHQASQYQASKPYRDTRYDLPPISTLDVPRPNAQQSGQFSLPPISSLKGDRPEMDAHTVLQRLKLSDEERDVPAASIPRYPPGTHYSDSAERDERSSHRSMHPQYHHQAPLPQRGGRQTW